MVSVDPPLRSRPVTRLAKVGGESSASLFLVGEIDIANRDELVALVRDALGRRITDVTLDMSGVTFIDCAGLGGVLQARSLAVQSGRSLRAITLSLPARRLLELTHTLSTLISEPTVGA